MLLADGVGLVSYFNNTFPFNEDKLIYYRLSKQALAYVDCSKLKVSYLGFLECYQI